MLSCPWCGWRACGVEAATLRQKHAQHAHGRSREELLSALEPAALRLLRHTTQEPA